MARLQGGPPDPEAAGRRGATAWIWGAAATAAWAALAYVLAGAAGPVALLTLFALPCIGIWLAVAQARALARLRAEVAGMRGALTVARAAPPAAAPAAATAPAAAAPAAEFGSVRAAAAPLRTAAPAVAFASGRDRARAARPENPQSALPFGTDAAPTPPLPPEELIRALHFPETADDTAGFRALRRALKDQRAAQVVQAAQDMLTLLSQDGLYMDDLAPDRARPELWRRFARGERGGPIGAVGGIRDERALAVCAGRMRGDTVFRDAAHHFLRRFDRLLAELEPQVDDTGIAALSETRSARAFMLLGRCAGMFD